MYSVEVQKDLGGWKVWIVSGCQRFQVGPPRPDYAEANHYANLLRVVLQLPKEE